MKLAVSALASILPQGEGIEVFNHIVYEGLVSRGQFSNDLSNEALWLDKLNKQLHEKDNGIQFSEKNILLPLSSQVLLQSTKVKGDYQSAKNLFDALALAKKLLNSGFDRINIFSCNITEQQKHLDSVQQFSFSNNFNFSPEKKGSDFALAFSVVQYRKDMSDYFSIIEDYDVIDDQLKKKVSVLETNAFRSIEHLKSEFDFHSKDLSVAIGCVATSFGYQNACLDMAAFIKAVLQCYHRYIAGVPTWESKNADLPWQGSSFYISEQSKSWFVEGQDTPRYCMLSTFDKDNKKQILLSDRGIGLDRTSQYFSYSSPHFFPLAGNCLEDFQKQLARLSIDIESAHTFISLRTLAKAYYQSFMDSEDTLDIKQYRAVVLGEDAKALSLEIEILVSTLPQSFAEDAKHEIKTPKGSYFTTEPLGDEGKVAFVFPGLGSSYVGLGQKIFQLFPSIFKESFRFTENVGEELQEKTLYPRTQDALSFQEKRLRDMEIIMNLKDLGKTDTTYSSICAHVMTDVFKVHPDMAFGYSMGEANMMTALDVWQTPTELENRFKQSDIFKNRLYGDLKTVKQFWDEKESTSPETIWTTYSLKTNSAKVEACIKEGNLNRVYITLINTEDSVVIAGDPKQCEKLIDKIQCRALPMGFVPAIHCEPTAQEYEGIAELYSMPTTDTTSTKLYSSSCYLPVPVRQKAISYAIAKCFCEPVDFPRLVDKVYQDGARIFLEAGAGRICSTWIDKILHDKKHVVVPLNAKGTDDSLTFARVMAKLFCHKVGVNLAPLYENVIERDA